MKTKIRTKGFASRTLVRQLLPVIAAIFTTFATAGEPAPVTTEAKPFTLFMGADIAVEWNAKLYPVLYVTGSSFVIQAEGKLVKVPTDFGRSKFRIESALRLKETSAVVTDLKNERTYTLGNDPTVRFQRGLADSQLLYADSQGALEQANSGFTFGDITSSAIIYAIITGPYKNYPPSEKTLSNRRVAQAYRTRLAGDPGSTFHESGSPLEGEGMFDAVEVSFEVASPLTLKHPYVVMTARYRGSDDKPGMVHNWVYARELPVIGREARKVEFTQGGFPPGFTMEEFQFHLYNQGQEIATSVAPKRLELTRDEAFQYITVEYISSHAGETLPVGPAVGRLPAHFSTRVAEGQLQRTYFVKVTKDGVIRGLFADEACAQRIDDPYLDSVINELRFVPALDRGRPVDGVTAIKLTLPES